MILVKARVSSVFLKKLGYLVNSKATFHLWSKKQDKHCSMILKIIEKVSFNIVNEASYQTGHFWCDKNWWKIPKLGNTNATIWVIFKQCAYPQAMILHDKYNPNFCRNIFNRIFFRLQFILRTITNYFWELLARGRFFKKWEKWIFFGNDSLDYRPKSALVILRQSTQDVLRISLEILFW